MRIWIALLAISGIAIAYLLVPNRENVGRRNRALDEHAVGIAAALKDSGQLIEALKEIKSVQQRKTELQTLRQRSLDLNHQAKDIVAEESVEARVAADRLEELEPQFYSLKRDTEDLRARLRVMTEVHEQIRGLIAKIGRHTRALSSLKQTSGDLAFNQRVAEEILVITSGLGGFPRGIPIGRVNGVADEEGSWRKSYWLEPMVETGSATHVLVLTAGATDDVSAIWPTDSLLTPEGQRGPGS